MKSERFTKPISLEFSTDVGLIQFSVFSSADDFDCLIIALLMAVVIPTDRPKSVHTRCVIEVFGAVFVLSIGCLIFCWYKGFRHRTESDPVLFLSRQESCSEAGSSYIKYDGKHYSMINR